MVAEVRVNGMVYVNDRAYDYAVPFALEGRVQVGSRVQVPYGLGNRCREAVVVALKPTSTFEKLKQLQAVLDVPPLTGEQLALAGYVKRQCFCTFYDAVRLMLPPGALAGFAEQEPVLKQDKATCRAAQLVDEQTAMAYREQLPQRMEKQRRVLEVLFKEGTLPVADLCRMAGCTSHVVGTLQRNGIIKWVQQEVQRSPYAGLPRGNQGAQGLILTPEQQQAEQRICRALDEQKPACTLLWGVTGSGKTVVFLRAIRAALDRGRTALLLVPEIALTPQMVSIFYLHFGEDVAVLHSRMSHGERADAYRSILRGERRIVIGTRLSVFAPLSHLGILIVDEEQEGTYKSEQNPRYDAREVAKFRCVRHGALLLLASATPRVETFYAVQQGTYGLLQLQQRYNGRPLPQVDIVDMTAEMKAGNRTPFSRLMQQRLMHCLQRGEQAILFLNRRGHSSFVCCRECGHVLTCPHCSISMTYHRDTGKLQCHYCGHAQQPPSTCPQCGSPYIRYFGMGTQKAEQQLQALFPQARILRMDMDTTARKGAHQKLLEQFRAHRADVLIGTQMVVKGLDFENVTFVGVLNADMSLYMEDFRAAQNTFHLIAQVVGRSGRGEKEGCALIQTYHPDNSTIQYAAQQDYEAFYRQEIAVRKLLQYPPFCDLCAITLTGEQEQAVCDTVLAMAAALRKVLDTLPGATLIGPSPCRVAKVKNEYRYRILIKCKNDKRMRGIIDSMMKTFYNKKEYRNMSLSVDMNPYSF